MDLVEYARWLGAALFWVVALVALWANIRRHKTNQAYYEAGSDRRVSGAAFVFTLFAWIGAAVSPPGWSALWLLCLFGEVPALVNFLAEKPSESETPQSEHSKNKDESSDS